VENRLLDDMNKVMITTGYRYYVLLRTISDFETEPNSGLDKLFDSSEPAIKFYSQGTCCLEIAKDRLNDTPEIVRIYFQVPCPKP
jgi:hypothetical protein